MILPILIKFLKNTRVFLQKTILLNTEIILKNSRHSFHQSLSYMVQKPISIENISKVKQDCGDVNKFHYRNRATKNV